MRKLPTLGVVVVLRSLALFMFAMAVWAVETNFGTAVGLCIGAGVLFTMVETVRIP
jgi:hypothetical protein